MKKSIFIIIVCLISAFFLVRLTDKDSGSDYLIESMLFFNDNYVHKVSMYIDDPDWFNVLYENHTDENDPYEAGALAHEYYSFYPVGIRFKGNSSFGYSGNKKSFKVDVNEFFENCNILDTLPECQELKFYGLQKINFNNGFKDPSFLREKIFFDIAGNYLPTPRTVFTEVYVNDQYMGLYTMVEQPDSTFIKMHYEEEVGNLFECEKSGGKSTFGSDLAYLGEDLEEYYDYYELKTSENKKAWKSLYHFIDVLNNYDDDEFIKEIEEIADTDQFLAMLALNNIFGNYDSYSGSAHNYYIYEDTDGIFHPILWDGNESFGTFKNGAPEDLENADIFYGDGILEQRFYNIPEYRQRYIEIVEDITKKYFDPGKIKITITDNAELIRPSVYRDFQKMYTNEEFESALGYNVDPVNDEDEIIGGTVRIRGRDYTFEKNRKTINLVDFIEARYESIISQLQNINL